jgi:peptidyl-prolyl cis-trans isomerase SurA
MFPLILTLLLSVGSSHAQDKLLDKIVAVVNGRVYSLSELKRVDATLGARREISPFLYAAKAYQQTELLDLMIKTQVIRDKIGSQGYVVGDDAVESRISMTEQKLGLNRDSLLEFLKGKGVTYEEYFEIIREAMEYNLFTTRIIGPLVTVTEQELKNEFYKRHSNDKALSFTYELVDFSVPESEAKGKTPDTFVSALKDYQVTGRLGYGYQDLDASPLENIKEDALASSIQTALSKTPEGNFAPPIVLGGRLHSFYVKKKDLVESAAYLRSKERLEEELFTEKSHSLTANWFDREYTNYYIKKSL